MFDVIFNNEGSPISIVQAKHSKPLNTKIHTVCKRELCFSRQTCYLMYFVSQVIKCIKVSVLGCVSNGLWGQKNFIPYQISLVIVCSLVSCLLTTTANQRPSTSDHFSFIKLSFCYFTIFNGDV